MTHTFKPYADDQNLCVAELPCGDTCNLDVTQHASISMRIRVENTYSDGHQSTLEYDINGGSVAYALLDGIDTIWDLLWEYTGDGHDTNGDLGYCHEITIIACDWQPLVGQREEWLG